MQALIFDVDGTLADTETAHLHAFNAAFAEAGLDWYWDEALYTHLLKVAGGKERLLHYWRIADPEEAEGSSVSSVIDAVHAIKTRHYAARVRDGGLPLRPGIARLISEAEAASIPVAIATTTTPANLDALLQAPFGPDWRNRFAAICDAGTTQAKKPSPDVYLDVLRQLGLKGADCVAFEDSVNGLRAARAAFVPTVVTPTAYSSQDRFEGALAVLPHLGDPHTPIPSTDADQQPAWVDLATLRRWHRNALNETAAV
ncbi:HAD family hydrolase [Paraburkholderia rhynchosiae]|uniref:Protein CbbY n=1 Tax=Paraburkholderia rhynchosiae TaxID=487049 RepID=A0A2N7WMA5_9BURK|nr:HAD family hydrolase [Paraburkholderia rhynchosiae]PMS30568.1 protein CbbY [Paraburkholderia rhynchosiae]CAB3683797.1 Protein CbbY [Paraburkholderia rhynchosiae]